MSKTRLLLLAGTVIPAIALSAPSRAAPSSADRPIVVAQGLGEDGGGGRKERQRGGDDESGGSKPSRAERSRGGDDAGGAKPPKMERSRGGDDEGGRSSRPERASPRGGDEPGGDRPGKAEKPERKMRDDAAPSRAESGSRSRDDAGAREDGGSRRGASETAPDAKPSRNPDAGARSRDEGPAGLRDRMNSDKGEKAGDKPSRVPDAGSRSRDDAASPSDRRSADPAATTDRPSGDRPDATTRGRSSDDRAPSDDRTRSDSDRRDGDKRDADKRDGAGRPGDSGDRKSLEDRMRDRDRDPAARDGDRNRDAGDRDRGDRDRDARDRDARDGDRDRDRDRARDDRDRSRDDGASRDERRERFERRLNERRGRGDDDLRDSRYGFSMDRVRSDRRERRDGDRVIITEGDRTIIREGDRTFIRRDENARFRIGARDFREERRNGEIRTIVDRPDGSQVITVTDEDGRLISRTRRYQNEEYVLIDNRPRGGRGGAGAFIDLGLPPPRVTIPRDRYIVDADEAPYEVVEETFAAPPVERIERSYTLDEIRQNAPLRQRVRSVDLDSVNFDTGSWEVRDDQIKKLETVGLAMEAAVKKNPKTVFMVEGYTDAVGSAEDNLSLSDRRAQSVAEILTKYFDIPAENLTTQGYGEQYLKVQSDGPEERNRRVTVRNITSLLSAKND